jgi:hypothetical protein
LKVRVCSSRLCDFILWHSPAQNPFRLSLSPFAISLFLAARFQVRFLV